MNNLLYNPGIVFALCFVCTVVLYKIGQAMSAKGEPAAGKETVYACGEDVEGEFGVLGYNWFHIAFVFTLLDIAVLIVATMPRDVNLLLSGAWIVGGIIAIIMLLRD
ncbi:MAG: hypothetical protein R6V19_02980 [Armatimonadota bacterium]